MTIMYLVIFMSKEPSLRYIFRSRDRQMTLTAEDFRNLRREIRLYVKELAEFNISLTGLCESRETAEDRNRCLNIALQLINQPKLSQELVQSKKLNAMAAARETGYSRRFIENFQKLIVAYMILFGSESYAFISRQISIGTSLEKTNPAQDYMGIKLKDYGVTNCVLTPLGEFRFLDAKGKNPPVGGYMRGRPAILRPKRAIFISLALVASLLSLLLFSYLFYQPARTAHLIGPVEASFSFNRFGRLISLESNQTKSRQVIKDMVPGNHKVDSSLANFLEEAQAKKYLSAGDRLTLVVLDGSFSQEDFKSPALRQVLLDNKWQLRINNGDGSALILPDKEETGPKNTSNTK